MTKKQILFTFLFGAFTSSVEAGNFQENWSEFQALKTKVADPTLSDADLIATFQTYRTHTSQHDTSGRAKCIAANEPLINFQTNYGVLSSYYDIQGAENTVTPSSPASGSPKEALTFVETCLKSRLSDHGKKWILFRSAKQSMGGIPDDKTQISAQISVLENLFRRSGLAPETKYDVDVTTGTSTYTQAYIRQQYETYVKASAIIAPQSELAALPASTRAALEALDVSLADVTAKLNETDASVWTFFNTRKEKWKSLAGNDSYVVGDSISPALPF